MLLWLFVSTLYTLSHHVGKRSCRGQVSSAQEHFHFISFPLKYLSLPDQSDPANSSHSPTSIKFPLCAANHWVPADELNYIFPKALTITVKCSCLNFFTAFIFTLSTKATLTYCYLQGSDPSLCPDGKLTSASRALLSLSLEPSRGSFSWVECNAHGSSPPLPLHALQAKGSHRDQLPCWPSLIRLSFLVSFLSLLCQNSWTCLLRWYKNCSLINICIRHRAGSKRDSDAGRKSRLFGMGRNTGWQAKQARVSKRAEEETLVTSKTG